MSLINDMLRDLEARKRAAQQRGDEPSVADRELPQGAPPRDPESRPVATLPHLQPLRDAATRAGPDEGVRWHGRWLIPLYALGLAALAMSIYVTVAGPNGLLQRDSYSRATHEPVAATTSANSAVRDKPIAASAVAPVAKVAPRLVMIGIDEASGPALTLRLSFAPALSAPLRVNAAEGRVQLSTEGAEVGSLDSPSPLLSDWRSEQKDMRWQASFAWAGPVDVSLLPVLGEDASQGWVIRLLPDSDSPPPMQSSASVASRAPPPAAASRPPTAPAVTPFPENRPSASRAVPTLSAMPALAASAPANSVARNAETLYADAWRLQQAGQLNDAIGRLEVLLEREPLHARGRELLARLWLRAERGDRAMQVLNDGLAAVPQQPAWVELQARLLDNSGRRAEAIALLDRQGSPERLSHQALRGVLNTQEGRFADAANAYQLALALDPTQARWWLGLAVAWDNLGDRSAARNAYQGALDNGELDSGSARFVRERLGALTDGAKP